MPATLLTLNRTIWLILVDTTGVMSSQVGIVEGLVTNNRYPEVKLGHIRDTYPRPVAPNFVTGSVRSGVLSFSVQ